MKLREFYENNGVDYDAFLHRLMDKESLVVKYIKIFLADPTYEKLAIAIAERNYEEVDKEAHTLKGIALNLDLKKLSGLCIETMNVARLGNMKEIEEQFGQLKLEYEYIVSELQD